MEVKEIVSNSAISRSKKQTERSLIQFQSLGVFCIHTYMNIYACIEISKISFLNAAKVTNNIHRHFLE